MYLTHNGLQINDDGRPISYAFWRRPIQLPSWHGVAVSTRLSFSLLLKLRRAVDCRLHDASSSALMVSATSRPSLGYLEKLESEPLQLLDHAYGTVYTSVYRRLLVTCQCVTHSLTAALDQLRVVAISTTSGPGSRIGRH